MEYTYNALKNATFNFIGYLYPMILAFIVAPITVNFLGVRNYGLYVFISTVISLLGLLDLGTSTAVSKFLANYNATKSEEKIKTLIGSANTVFFLVGLAGFLLFAVAALFGHLFIPASVIGYPNYAIAFIFAGLLFFVSSLNSIYSIIPTALGRFDLSTKVGLITITLQQGGIILAVLLHYSIATIFAVQFLIAIVGTILCRYVSKILIPYLSYSFAWDKKEVSNFYKFGITVFTNNIAGSSLTYFDRMLIPFLLGPSNLTFYSLPGNITSKTPGLVNTLSGTLFPMTAHFDSLGDTEKIKTLYIRSTRLLLIISTAITIGIISFPYEILKYWINAEVANKSSLVLVILALTCLVLSVLSPISNLLLGLGKLKSLTKTSIAMAIINIALLFALIPKFGIEGAAWAYLLSLLPIIWLIYRVEKVYLELSEKRALFYLQMISKLGIVSMITYLLNVLFMKKLVVNLFSLAIIGPLSILIFLALYRIFGFFEKQDLADLKAFSKRIIKR